MKHVKHFLNVNEKGNTTWSRDTAANRAPATVGGGRLGGKVVITKGRHAIKRGGNLNNGVCVTYVIDTMFTFAYA